MTSNKIVEVELNFIYYFFDFTRYSGNTFKNETEDVCFLALVFFDFIFEVEFGQSKFFNFIYY